MRQWPPRPVLLAPLRFLNTFEEQLLRHRRPRTPLSFGDSMPRRVRKLPLDGSRPPVNDVSIFEYEYANSDIRDDILDERAAVHLLHECKSRHRLNLSPKGKFRRRVVGLMMLFKWKVSITFSNNSLGSNEKTY